MSEQSSIYQDDLNRLTEEWVRSTNSIEEHIQDCMKHAQDSAYATGYRRGAEAIKETRQQLDSLTSECDVLRKCHSFNRESIESLKAKCDELVVALAAMRSVCFDKRKANDEFERLGELYYREVGRLRPGKDDPMRNSCDDENTAQYNEWSRKRTEAAIDLADAAIAKVGAGETA